MNLKNKIKFHFVITFLAVFVFIITAWNSHGYYHADEHYQIIEFAGLKLGTHIPKELAWEFKAQIRSAIQPSICFVILKTLQTLDISDPYSQVFILRLLTALIALLIINSFIKQTEIMFDNERIKMIYRLLSYFLWFIPFISVRFSSETWSGLIFIWALTVFFKNEKMLSKPFTIGLILGLSFLFRFQLAFALIGFILWLAFIRRAKGSFLLSMCIAFVLVVLFGFFVDSWFYGEFVFSPWKYFCINIVKDAAPEFGTSPWYFYIVKLITYPSYFIGIPLTISLIILIFYDRKNIFIWTIIPFILLHSIIPHKEERFMFPIVYLFPIILTLGYTQLLHIIFNKTVIRFINYFLVIVFFAVNLTGLIAMAQKSAGIGRMEITKYIHDNFGDKPINLIYCPWANPYNPWNSLPVKFYLEHNMVNKQINNLCELNDSLIIPGAENILIVRKADLENEECCKQIQQKHFFFLKQSIPKWIEYLNREYKGYENRDILVLYKYNK